MGLGFSSKGDLSRGLEMRKTDRKTKAFQRGTRRGKRREG